MILEIQVLACNGQQKCKLNYTDQQKKCNTIFILYHVDIPYHYEKKV